jgi:hypothetical protein
MGISQATADSGVTLVARFFVGSSENMRRVR